MQNGKWIPISKFFADSLPRNRKFTDLEAMYSLQLDYDNNNSITVSGCASRWGWSRSKVSKFLSDSEIVIIYPGDTKTQKKQRGMIDIHPDKKRHKKEHKKDNKETLKEHKRFIDSRWLQDQKDIKKTLKRHKKSNKKSTTIDPDKILDPNPESLNTFSEECQEMKLSKYFYKVLLKSDSDNKQPDFQNWSSDFDKIIRIDKRSAGDIQKIINYAHDPKNSSDKFSWIPNLRSPKKIREHFTTIKLQSERISSDSKTTRSERQPEPNENEFQFPKNYDEHIPI